MAVTLIEAFPTLDALEAAPLHDVAAFVLNRANQTQQPSFHRENLISSLADAYINQPTAELPHVRRDRARRVVAEAVGYLASQNFICRDGQPGMSGADMVTRLGRSILTREDFASYAKAALLPRDLLRQELVEIALPLFLAGHYDDAVSAAFKRVEIAVREAGKFSNDDFGVPLMRSAFGKGGPLRNPAEVENEQKALEHLFAGAIGFFKNPLSHREVGIEDARLAASRILFANELLALLNLQALAIQANKAQL